MALACDRRYVGGDVWCACDNSVVCINENQENDFETISQTISNFTRRNPTDTEIVHLLIQAILNTCNTRIDVLSKACTNPRDFHEPIIKAVDTGNSKILKTLLENNFDPCSYKKVDTIPFRLSAIDLALQRKDILSAKLLMQYGAKPDIYFGVTESVERGNDVHLFFLQSHFSEDVSSVIKFHSAGFLHTAVEKGHTEVIKLLKQLGADINLAIHQRGTPLMCARRPDVINLLIPHGADVNAKLPAEFNSSTALLHAVSVGFYSKFVNSQENVSKSSNMIMNDIQDIIKSLVSNGANVDDRNIDGKTALMVAVEQSEYSEIVEFLISKHANTNLRNKEGKTALHLAVSSRCRANIDVLLKSKVDLDVQCKSGMTALHEAVRTGQRTVVVALIQHKADVGLTDAKGNSPLHHTVISECSDTGIAELLYYAGCELDQSNHDGYTPVMLAAERLQMDYVKLFCKLGADVNLMNSKIGKTALNYILNVKHRSETREMVCDGISYLLGKIDKLPKIDPMKFHFLIFEGRIELLHKFVCAGLKPDNVELRLQNYDGYNSQQVLSPIAFALLCNEVEIAGYFYDLGFTTKGDLLLKTSQQSITKFLESKEYTQGLQFLSEFSPRAVRLQSMCFLTISSAVGFGKERETKVGSLGLPRVFQRKLLLQPDNLASTGRERGGPRDEYRFQKLLLTFDRFCVAEQLIPGHVNTR
ncbi:E3 ubiquitin-protein ligase mib1-like [Physella acuta]|uniref:E3 ubiquitin-protein ligase mib1-like n=1 Tax=Physella acuta TaxID=109671 RepID=UPI0027DBBD72|nr:E3 ubiquitin-protein ligase mib1-like [Physella acuta]XP_059172808.1 E3 ubiquitin-protein ligase mib1-like [Physella acuta]XP_059172809.1 E3 ubiquitin-protein ligase mib1-like [Physella acuta]